MDLITALAISISVLGAIATYVLLSPIGLGLQIWAVFIAWATFYHCGGKEAGLSKTITQTIFGAIMAYIALLLVTQVPLGAALGVPLWAAIAILITVFILVYAAKSPMLSDIPASVLGFAATAALALAGKKLDALTSASLDNPFINIVLSLIVGAVLGYISEKAAGAMVKK
jgi:small basic protein